VVWPALLALYCSGLWFVVVCAVSLSFLGGVDCQHLMVMTCPKANIVLVHRSCWAVVPSKSSKEKDREETDPAEYCMGLFTQEGCCVVVRVAVMHSFAVD
jgi:hypothetical protein